MNRRCTSLPLAPAPEPRHLLLGWAAQRDAGQSLEPFLLAGDHALAGEAPQPYLVMGAWPEARLGFKPQAAAAFPWQADTQDCLRDIQDFIGDAAGAGTEEDPFMQGPLTVGWVGHEISHSHLVRQRAWLVLHPQRGQAQLVVPGEGEAAGEVLRGLARDIRQTEEAGAQLVGRRPAPCRLRVPVSEACHSGRVRQVLEAIRAGDVYQVNLAHPLIVEGFPQDCLGRAAAFLHLWSVNPVPYPAFVQQGEQAMLSFSPERYLARRADRLESRPIKGTRPRGDAATADRQLATALAHSAKDRAENVMIVDLVRNDMGRIACTGSVEVKALCQVESYASVHHLVSTVSARILPDTSLSAILDALHPPGSMTGAPKRRAVSILEALEGRPRGAYAGGVGWFCGPRSFHLSMVIRTLLTDSGGARLFAGGGIVADSEPADEYRETLHKAASLLRELGCPPTQVSRR